MRCFFVHPIARRGNFQDISRLCPFRVGLPEMIRVSLAVLAGLGLRMFRILERVIPVRNPHIVNVECKLWLFLKVQDAFVRARPQSAPRLALFL